MKDKKIEIDELLNAYVDGELSERHCTEVKRLIANDPSLELRLAEIEKCQSLLNSSPSEECPENFVDGVKSMLERKVLLAEYSPEPFEAEGHKYLKLRYLLSRAAMVLLLAGLGYIIFSIVPRGGEFFGVEQEPVVLLEEQDAFKEGLALVDEHEEAADIFAGTGVIDEEIFWAVLNLGTDNPSAVNKAIGRSVYDNDLLSCTSIERQGVDSCYSIMCSGEELANLVLDMANIWDKFTYSKLSIYKRPTADEIMIDHVQAEQVAAVLNAEDAQGREHVARDFAFLNSFKSQVPGKAVLDYIDEQSDIAVFRKPVLTSGERKRIGDAGMSDNKDRILLVIKVYQD